MSGAVYEPIMDDSLSYVRLVDAGRQVGWTSVCCRTLLVDVDAVVVDAVVVFAGDDE